MKKTIMFLTILFTLVLVVGCTGDETYTVNFDLNGGPGSITAIEVKENEKVSKPEEPTWEEHAFDGWYLGDKKWSFTVDKVTEDITLVAKWVDLDDELPIKTTNLILDENGNYGGSIDEEKYGKGAPLNGEYDNPDSEYYLINDFYNMESTQDRTIFTNFAPYQQQMANTGGIASALMVLNDMGEDVKDLYNETQLVNMYETINDETIYGNGTSSTGLVNLFEDIGYEAVSDNYVETGNSTEDKISNFESWLHVQLNDGKYVMVRYQSEREFGWHVIVGIDSMGTDYSRDDVLIMANPYDGSDHYQDGYSTEAAGRFYRWWFNVEKSGVRTNEFECVVVTPEVPRIIMRTSEERERTQIVPEINLILNADGSYAGTRDAEKYGTTRSHNGSLDQLDANYHAFVDYYNMENTDSRLILPKYRAFQQTMASSCGISSILTVLNYYGEDVSVYDEVYLVEKYEEINDSTIRGRGVGSIGLRNLVAEFGYVAEASSFSRDRYVDEDSLTFKNYEEFLQWVKGNLERGVPMPVSWRPHGGHWEVIIGIDTMGTDYIYDDVIVLADSGDTWDHYQDGYNTIPATLFFRQWYNGSFSYNQQYCVFDPIEK